MERNVKFNFGNLGFGIFFFWLLAFFVVAGLYSNLEETPFFICIFFFFPLLHFGFVSCIIEKSFTRSFFLATIGSCAFFHFLAWFLYIQDRKSSWLSGYREEMGYSYLFLTALVALACFIFTALTIRDHHIVSKNVADFPLLAINFFMSAFLYVTFFLTFSLTFFDRSDNRALYVEEIVLSQDTAEKVESKAYGGRFFFEEGSVHVKFDEGLFNNDLYHEASLEDPMKAHRELKNAETMRSFRETLTLLGEHARLEIVLCGHANQKELREQAKERYVNNGGVASERAQWATESLVQVLREKGKGESSTFRYLNCFAGDRFLDEANKKVPKGFDTELQVEIAAYRRDEPGQKYIGGMANLALLDYFYFMVYTITTTGYGDMIPVSPQAKFVTSFANLLEVFFLVIFFNILLTSIRRSQNLAPPAALQPPTPAPSPEKRMTEPQIMEKAPPTPGKEGTPGNSSPLPTPG